MTSRKRGLGARDFGEHARPAVERAYAKAKEVNPNAGGIRTAEERAILFGQTAASVQAAVR